MNTTRIIILALTLAAITAGAVAWQNPAGHEFSATAVMNTRQGTRRMPVTLIARRYASESEAEQLKGVLETSGQGGLLSVLRNRADGTFRMGMLDFPVGLVSAEEIRGGFRYVFVSSRRIQVEESKFAQPSLDYPFGVAIIEVSSFGRGEGEFYPAAAIRVDPYDDSIVVEQYDGEPGQLKDVKQL